MGLEDGEAAGGCKGRPYEGDGDDTSSAPRLFAKRKAVGHLLLKEKAWGNPCGGTAGGRKGRPYEEDGDPSVTAGP